VWGAEERSRTFFTKAARDRRAHAEARNAPFLAFLICQRTRRFMIRLDTDDARSFLDPEILDALRPQADAAHQALLDKSGAGSDMLGWRDMLLDPDDALLEDIEQTAARLRRDADVLLCLGIGGSYLGAQAVIRALTPYVRTPQDAAPTEANPDAQSAAPNQPPAIHFAGHHTSGAYLRELLDGLEGQSVYVNVISKSGTTLETALAFRLVRDWMESRFDDADARIIVTTDPETGALNTLREDRGYKKYVIPRDVGGRFSVLTPVGLLPIAAAGIDIRALFYGAVSMCEDLADAEGNPALAYAMVRYVLVGAGYTVEALAVFEPKLRDIGAWWQQLFGESEGKEGKGLYPSTVQYTTDLHSLGQYMQDGRRTVVETFLMLEDDAGDLEIPSTDEDLDGLNYIAGRTFSDVTMAAYEGTKNAHHSGGVPIMTLWLDVLSPGTLGEMIYFFEHAVAVSGYLLEVNPFNQPGVEAYKKEMYQLLGKKQ
jgi:glucose-6-phosphate isomerase